MIVKDTGRVLRTNKIIVGGLGLALMMMVTFHLFNEKAINSTRTFSAVDKSAENASSLHFGDVYSPDSDRCLVVAGVKNIICRLNPCQNWRQANQQLQRGFAVRYPDTFRLSNNSLPMQVAGSAMSGSGCALSRKYGFLFIHNLKVGGTTTKSFLREALCPPPNDGASRRLETSAVNRSSAVNRWMQVRTRSNLPPGLRRGRKPIFQCSKGDETLQIVDCIAGLRIAKENSFFIWSFVRNPFSRLYSGYAMAMAMARPSDNRTAEGVPSPEGSGTEFRDFALASQSDRQKMSRTHASHYMPQSYFLSDRNGCPIFDYVGRLEFYEEDLLRSIQLIEERYHNDNNNTEPLPPTPLMVQYRKRLGANGRIQAVNGTSFGKRRQDNNIDDGMASAYADGDVVKKVVQEYRSDFKLFGYPTVVENAYITENEYIR